MGGGLRLDAPPRWYTSKASQVAASGPRRGAVRSPRGTSSRKVRTPQSRALA